MVRMSHSWRPAFGRRKWTQLCAPQLGGPVLLQSSCDFHAQHPVQNLAKAPSSWRPGPLCMLSLSPRSPHSSCPLPVSMFVRACSHLPFLSPYGTFGGGGREVKHKHTPTLAWKSEMDSQRLHRGLDCDLSKHLASKLCIGQLAP